MLTGKTRRGASLQWGLWIVAKEWGNDTPQPLGIWTGQYSRRFLVNGQDRQYEGMGTLLGVDDIVYQPGAGVVQTQTALVGGITPALELVLRGYNPIRAKVELHQIYLDPQSENVLSIERAFKGEIDTIEFEEGEFTLPELKGTATCQINMVSMARNGTKPLTLTKSDGTQRLVLASDDGRKYADISGATPVTWMGESNNPYKVEDQPKWNR